MPISASVDGVRLYSFRVFGVFRGEPATVGSLRLGRPFGLSQSPRTTCGSLHVPCSMGCLSPLAMPISTGCRVSKCSIGGRPPIMAAISGLTPSDRPRPLSLSKGDLRLAGCRTRPKHLKPDPIGLLFGLRPSAFAIPAALRASADKSATARQAGVCPPVSGVCSSSSGRPTLVSGLRHLASVPPSSALRLPNPRPKPPTRHAVAGCALTPSDRRPDARRQRPDTCP